MLLGKTTSLLGVHREYHSDDDLGFHAIIKHDDDVHLRNIAFCKAAQDNYLPESNKNDIRLIGLVSIDLYLKILLEKGVEDIYSQEAADVVKNEILLNPAYRYCRTVPDNMISHEDL